MSAKLPSADRCADAVILFSHGSLLCGAGLPLDEHAARMRESGKFGQVEVGYLNYSTPTFEEAVAKVTATGDATVVVVPFFLVPGYFVTKSLPKMLADVSSRFPHVTFKVAEPLGADDAFVDAVLHAALAARTPERWRDGLVQAGLSCMKRAECPIYGEFGCRAGEAPITQPVAIHDRPRSKTQRGFDDRRTALLILAHGSPSADANLPMLEVVEKLEERYGEFVTVVVGYLECNQPSIPEAIDLCAEADPELIVTVPYFLHTGKHVASDLPDALDEGRKRYPRIEFALGDFIGNMPQVTDVLVKRALSRAAQPE